MSINYKVDLTGEKYGRLFVVEFVPTSDKRRTFWKCKCDCGNVVIRRQDQIGKLISSCGCLRKEKITKANISRQLDDDIAGIRRAICQVRGVARHNEKDWFLTVEEVEDIILQPCFYCGEEGSNTIVLRGITRNEKLFKYNGIDRVDSSRGYCLDNVVPCCKYCNVAKNNMSATDFLAHIEKIYLHSIAGNRDE